MTIATVTSQPRAAGMTSVQTRKAPGDSGGFSNVMESRSGQTVSGSRDQDTGARSVSGSHAPEVKALNAGNVREAGAYAYGPHPELSGLPVEGMPRYSKDVIDGLPMEPMVPEEVIDGLPMEPVDPEEVADGLPVEPMDPEDVIDGLPVEPMEPEEVIDGLPVEPMDPEEVADGLPVEPMDPEVVIDGLPVEVDLQIDGPPVEKSPRVVEAGSDRPVGSSAEQRVFADGLALETMSSLFGRYARFAGPHQISDR